MTREEELELLLTDIRFCVAGVLAQPKNEALRAELRRAGNRIDAFYQREKAQAEYEANHPQPNDPRPEPPPIDGAPEPTEQQARLPYNDD